MLREFSHRTLLAAALLIALVWPAHMATEDYQPYEYCQVCSVVCSPELNSDCDGVLPERPATFVISVRCPLPVSYDAALPQAFSGRAPPAV
jgi:hypothetical protein